MKFYVHIIADKLHLFNIDLFFVLTDCNYIIDFSPN